MYVVFFSTNDVFEAEGIFSKIKVDCKVVPTPVTDRAYCGVCLEIDNNSELDIIANLEYKVIAEV